MKKLLGIFNSKTSDVAGTTECNDANFEEAMILYKENNYVKAAEKFNLLAEKNHVLSQSTLGFMYLTGAGVPQDLRKGAFWFQKAAEQGNADSQGNIGIAYRFGQGVPQNFKQAHHWLEKSAEQGVPLAQYNLGGLFYYGQGIKQDFKKAAD